MGEDIRDIKPLVHVELGPPWWVYAAVAALVLLVLAGAVWWWRRRQKPAAPVVVAPPEPPEVMALRALAALATRPLPDLEAIYRLCAELSLVTRAYVEARFGLNATDLTTPEISRWLQHQHDLPAELRELLRELLSSTDEVKFAKAEPTAADCQRLIAAARTFVERTPRPAPIEASA